jgi:hypothetical protein
MDHAPFFVPHILAAEPNGVTNRNALDAWGEIDVMANEECLS